MSCGVGRRCGSDLVWLWLWRRTTPTALIRPLAWEPPYATGAALKANKQTMTKKTQNLVDRLMIDSKILKWNLLREIYTVGVLKPKTIRKKRFCSFYLKGCTKYIFKLYMLKMHHP